METKWLDLTEALKKCINLDGTFHYNYDARLSQLIDKYSPNNGYPHINNECYRTHSQNETRSAIDNWAEAQWNIEDAIITTSAQLELEDDDEAAKLKITPKLIEEKKLLVRGVIEINDVSEFPSSEADRSIQTKALFDVAVRAIEEFQKTPTALVLFPNLIIPDSRVFGGFYGSPWSTFNNRTLRLKFRNTNPHFEIHVCTVAEKELFPYTATSRKVGVLFTYTNPW